MEPPVALPFEEGSAEPSVRGFLHRAPGGGDGLVLAHGAGSSSQAPLLIALATCFAAAGITTLRIDLPFRQSRLAGPPRPGDAAKDRAGLRRAVVVLRGVVAGRLFLGGHSYGGRQASMLAAAEPGLASALLLLSYPLHPPGRPAERRADHLPALRAPVLFVHGSADAFGTIDEMESALRLIPGRTRLLVVDEARHDLFHGARPSKKAVGLAERIVAEFLALAG